MNKDDLSINVVTNLLIAKCRTRNACVVTNYIFDWNFAPEKGYVPPVFEKIK